MYEKEEGKISIKMASFQPLVLLQETYANFPFQSWELRPLGQDEALFTINGALITLSIKIQVTTITTTENTKTEESFREITAFLHLTLM